MYTTIRHYQDEADDVVEQIRPHAEGVRELLRGIPGFVAYYVVDSGPGSLVTVSVFADRAGADESTRVAAKFVGDVGLVERGALPNPPTIIAGEVVAHS